MQLGFARKKKIKKEYNNKELQILHSLSGESINLKKTKNISMNKAKPIV